MLAIGIVVDDAIVVVESVEHHIEHGMAPKAATIQAMSEVSAPVIAVGLVLSAVFIPCAFISGITGQFFRQFALTIASATVLSTINSLTLSPALAAMLLQPRQKGVYQALPRVVFLALGIWQGYVWLGPHFLPYFSGSGLMSRVAAASTVPGLGEVSSLTPEVASGLAGGLVGAIIAWVVSKPFNRVLGWFFDLFNRGFTATATHYSRLVGRMLRVFVLVFLVYGGLLFLTYNKFLSTPRGFIPSQDMGYLLVNVQLPDSAALERTQRVLHQLCEIATKNQGVSATVAIAGQSLLLNAYGSNFGTMFVTLDEFKKRPSPSPLMDAVGNWWQRLRGLKPKPPSARPLFRGDHEQAAGPACRRDPRGHHRDLRSPTAPRRGSCRRLDAHGRGSRRSWIRGRSRIEVEDLSRLANPGPAGDGIDADGNVIPVGQGVASRGPSDRAAVVGNLPGQRGIVGTPAQPRMTNSRRPSSTRWTDWPRSSGPTSRRSISMSTAPACMIKGVELRDVFMTLQVYLGSLYVNDFNRFGRTWQVIAQAEPKYRDQKDDINRLQVRNKRGTMVPLGAVAKVREINGPLVLTRYNMYPAASINGNAARGVSSGSAIRAMEGLSNHELPQSMSYEWTEMAYLELQAGNTAIYVFGFSIVMVFLVLAAQFESWAMPLAVILSVPLCMLSALYGVTNAKLPGCQQHQPGHQHLHPDRPGGAGRAGQQELDPDRPVRQADPRPGQADPRGHARGLPAAAAADHHDLDGVHPGRRSPALLPWRRGRDAAVAGRGRLQRHDRRDVLRRHADAGLLLRDRQHGRVPHLHQPDGEARGQDTPGGPDARRGVPRAVPAGPPQEHGGAKETRAQDEEPELAQYK